jgi:hypothetical protein
MGFIKILVGAAIGVVLALALAIAFLAGVGAVFG